jgi:penicillin-binding protein 1A
VEDMKKLLRSVTEVGTGKAAGKIPGVIVYGKTGTTQDHKDAWFIGFDNRLVTGVWVGNDDNAYTKNIVGGTLPLWIWRDYMQDLPKFNNTVLGSSRDRSIFDFINNDSE